MTNRALSKLYQVPLSFKTNRPTTAKGELEELFYKTADPVLELTLEIRSLDTNINNFIPNWKPHKDGRVHTTWGFTAASGQLDSSRPNILNLSKWTSTGQRFRRIVEAPTGYHFIEFDKKSFHVATAGYCAQDPDYIRFSQLGPHSIFASHICPRDWCKPITMDLPDGEIIERGNWLKRKCKEAKGNDPHGIDIRQDMAKKVVLGNQLGLGPRKLYTQNRRYIPSEARARELQEMIAGLFPKVAKFKDEIREQAHNQKYLLLKEWGIIDYFFDVYNWRYDTKIRGWKRGWGTDSEKSIAFPVQGQAFGTLKYELREMYNRGYLEEFGMVNTIHDSVVFLCEDGKVDRCLEEVPKVMNAPCPRMINKATGKEGLVVMVEASIGKNLQDLDYLGKGDNPEGMREVKLAA